MRGNSISLSHREEEGKEEEEDEEEKKKKKTEGEAHTAEHTEIDVGLLVQSKVRIFAFVEIFYSDLGII